MEDAGLWTSGVWARASIGAKGTSVVTFGGLDMARTVVAVDLAGGDTTVSDEAGIVGAARGHDGHLHILDDGSGCLGANDWGTHSLPPHPDRLHPYPAPHRTPRREPVRLGQRISNARRRKDRLPTDRIRALDALGMRRLSGLVAGGGCIRSVLAAGPRSSGRTSRDLRTEDSRGPA
ncbi:helicase associated domain-containing protein [Streptomyces sp. NBC_01799]|uniref:helicase associated domain-containing protein n=1 Tax=Streptomyces sp. NBC_01800 TaxID=2975945 RepID=UPI002DDC7014|nr:helicase associated domain-containing protein [Streptomyces sp. NBC_01800]WSA72519.1 helicase associated domain-containing protein [Streptomyces sp. NBC_01800]WSA81044.1 helicase associated domain-containing protein [Streptomyces sp. NBC_01799]